MSASVNVGDVNAVLRLIDEFTPVVDKVVASAQNMGNGVKSAMGNIGNAIADGLAGSAESLKGFGEVVTQFIENPIKSAHEFVIGLAEGLGPVGVGLGAIAGIAVAAGVALFELAERGAEVGSELNDMSEKTGIAVPALSDLKFAAEVAGSSLGQVSNAIFMMQNRIGQDMPKVEEGFSKIGLSLRSIKELSPDEQFLAIARAMKETEDPAQRFAAGVDIFGRGFRDLAPLMAKDLDELVAKSRELGLTWSTEDAQAAEDFEMRLRAIKLEFEGFGDRAGLAVMNFFDHPIDTIMGSIGWLIMNPGVAGQIGAATSLLMSPAPKDRGDIDLTGSPQLGSAPGATMSEMDKIWDLAAAEAKREHAKETAALAREQENLARTIEAAWDWTVKQVAAEVAAVEGTKAHTLATMPLEKALGSVGSGFHEVWEETTNVSESFVVTASGPLVEMADRMDNVGKKAKEVPINFRELSRTLSDLGKDFATVGKDMGGTFGQILDIGGIAIKGVSESLKGMASSMSAMDAATLSFGATYSATMAVAEVIGRAERQAWKDAAKDLAEVSSALDKLTSSSIDSQVRFDALAKAFEDSGRTGEQAANDWYIANHQTEFSLEQVNAALADINSSLTYEQQLQKAANEEAAKQKQLQQDEAGAWEDIQKALDKYHISLKDAGPMIQTKMLAQQAQQLVQDFILLTHSGVSLSVVLDHMGGSIQDVVTQALQFGVDLPSSMKPVLQAMIDAGQLTDQFGNKITSLKGSGLTFSDTLTEGFDKIADRLDILLRGLGLIPQELEAGVGAWGAYGKAAEKAINAANWTIPGGPPGVGLPGTPVPVGPGGPGGYGPPGGGITPGGMRPNAMGAIAINNHFYGVLVDGPSTRKALDEYVFAELPFAITRDVGGIRRVLKRAVN